LVEASPSLTNDGRPKRWVVIRPSGAQTGVLLARPDGEEQQRVVGSQLAGRVGFFFRVGDFDSAYERKESPGVKFLSSSRSEAYGQVAVFTDIPGNGPRPTTTRSNEPAFRVQRLRSPPCPLAFHPPAVVPPSIAQPATIDAINNASIDKPLNRRYRLPAPDALKSRERGTDLTTMASVALGA
jgi:hypothetical protein